MNVLGHPVYLDSDMDMNIIGVVGASVGAIVNIRGSNEDKTTLALVAGRQVEFVNGGGNDDHD